MPRRAANRVVFSGPFFEQDPAKAVRENIRGLVGAMTRETATLARSQFTSGTGSELASTIAERSITLKGRAYKGGVYSTMTGPNPRSPNPGSWVTFNETGRRRTGGTNAPAGKFKGFGQWRKTRAAVKRFLKEERIRRETMKGVV